MINLPGMDKVWAALPEARMVGGAVRDMLASRGVADVDFASPLSPLDVMARARKAGLKYIPTGLAHGTVTLLAEGQGFEVTTLRCDVETDGRHARVIFTDDWQEDAARRDFTINAMSCSRDGEIFDYFGGQADLAAGLVRFVGPATQRLTEDYLRILRFFRFFARYGHQNADEQALQAIAAEREGVLGLSVERIWSEIKKILQAPAPLDAIRLMQQTGILELILPGASLNRLEFLLACGGPADPLLRLAALSEEDLAQRLRLSGEEARRLQAWRAPFALRPDDSAQQLRRALADTSCDILVAQSWLYGEATQDWVDMRARLQAMDRPIFPLLGRDLALLGVPSGPQMGDLLQAVRHWWWEGGCVADKTACLEQAVQLCQRC